MKTNLLTITLLFTVVGLHAQQQLPLSSLEAFRPQDGNWQIVGDVYMDRTMDTHPPEPSKNKKKKIEKPGQAVYFTDGTGILLNINDQERKSNLLTTWEHGDIELQLEVMLPKGSNSGIYLQGRYEVQLLDSWGVKNPSYSDIGGIYRNWETEPSKILKGVPPATNAAKAPGLWQELKIMFHAPVFDDKGNKISNARFEYVDLNGIRLHANLEVPLPTGGPISKGEAATGPIMIQGDHGPVAIRNIRYRLLKESDAGVSSLTCQVYKGEFRSSDDFKTPVRSMATSAIDVGLAESENAYGLLFKGQVEIKTTDTYTFTLGYSGGIKFVLAGKTMIDQPASSWWSRPETNITLEPGTYSFEIHNFKTDGWIPPRLGFFVRGSATYDKPFHAYDSYPEMNGLSSPIWVEPAGSPKLHRGFVAFRDNGPKLSHTIAVGDPSGVHYIYDLNAGNLISVWRGPFLDATPMWEDRGNGSFRPRGATQWTFRNQPLAYLTDSQSAFPETGEKPSFFSKGYQLDAETGQPVFRHFYNGMEILTRISPDPTETYLLHSLYLKEVDSFQNLYLKLAEGESIRQMPDGSYAINDQQYYIKMVSGQTPIIRRSGDVTELIIAVDSPAITYSIIW